MKKAYTDYNKIAVSPLYYTGRVAVTLFRTFFLILITFIIMYPLVYMLSMAFRSPKDFLDVTVIWLPKTPTLDNFKTAIFDVKLLQAMGNSFSIAFVSSVLQLLTTCLAGYGFARYQFKFSGILFAAAVFTIIVPPQILSMPNYLLMKNFDVFGIYSLITGHASPLNLCDTLWSFYLPAMLGQGLRAGVFVLMFRQTFAALPKELEEASLIDGCGHFGTFFKIMLPNALTSVLVFFIFSFVWYWGDYYLASINLSSVQTLSTRISDLRYLLEEILPREKLTAYYIIPIEQAACVFSLLPPVVLFAFCQKYFVRGIDRSGIVG